MESIIAFVNKYFSLFSVPGTKIIIAALILIFTFVFRKLFSEWIIHYIKKWTERTETKLDDALIDILNPPFRFLIILIGLHLMRIVIGPVNPYFDDLIENILSFGYVVIVCWLLYRSADIFSDFLENAAKLTDTSLDDLLAPYLKKLVKIVAVIVVILKGAEVFLGMSAAALFGLLGGMGLTLGLVFKDIIANWFGCGIIYIDNLFREGDWVQLDDGRIVDADVEEIGVRSTRFRNFDKTVSVVPNATIANAVVKNWSRMYKRRVMYNFRIDGIIADKMDTLLQGMRTILENNDGVHQEFHMVNFREFDGNARIIRLYYFTKTTIWKEHEQVRENVNMEILKLLEKAEIDKLAYTIVDLSDDRPGDFQKSVSAN